MSVSELWNGLAEALLLGCHFFFVVDVFKGVAVAFVLAVFVFAVKISFSFSLLFLFSLSFSFSSMLSLLFLLLLLVSHWSSSFSLFFVSLLSSLLFLLSSFLLFALFFLLFYLSLFLQFFAALHSLIVLEVLVLSAFFCGVGVLPDVYDRWVWNECLYGNMWEDIGLLQFIGWWNCDHRLVQDES